MKTLLMLIFWVMALPLWAQEYAVGYKEKGLASYYDKSFHGKKTASGEQYDMFGYTAAHRSIPFNSVIKVTNIKNGQWITLRINDRGPLTSSRILDVSKRAALKLDMVKDNEVEVEIEILKLGDNKVADPAAVATALPEDSVSATPNKPEEKPATPVVAENTPKPAETVKPPETKPTENPKPATVAVSPAKPEDKPKTNVVTRGDNLKNSPGRAAANNPDLSNIPLNERFKKTGTYNVWGTPVSPDGYGIQLGTYKDIDTALKICGEAKKLGLNEVYIQSGWTQGAQNFRVMYASEPEQDRLRTELENVKKKGYMDAFIRKHFE